jgi:hypothetical protein
MAWSIERLDRAYAEGTVLINPVVYSDVSIRFSHIEELDAALKESGLVWSEIPREPLFLAEKAYLQYRNAGGQRASPLPYFLSAPTRDPESVRRYFPKLRIVCPE